MAFPGEDGTILTLDEALKKLRAAASATKAASQRLRTRALADQCRAIDLVDYLALAAAQRDLMDLMVAVPGLPAYAQEQYNNGGFVIATEYDAMKAAIDAARTWIVTNFPKAAGTNELLERTFDGAGRTVQKVFTAVQLAALVTLLDAVIAAIN